MTFHDPYVRFRQSLLDVPDAFFDDEMEQLWVQRAKTDNLVLPVVLARSIAPPAMWIGELVGLDGVYGPTAQDVLDKLVAMCRDEMGAATKDFTLQVAPRLFGPLDVTYFAPDASDIWQEVDALKPPTGVTITIDRP
jgi:hypothetical protein